MVLINLRGNLYILTFQDHGGFFFPNAYQRFTYNFPAVRAGHIPSPCCLNQVIFLRPDQAVFDPKSCQKDKCFFLKWWHDVPCQLSVVLGKKSYVWRHLGRFSSPVFTCGTKTDSVAVVFQPCGFIHF